MTVARSPEVADAIADIAAAGVVALNRARKDEAKVRALNLTAGLIERFLPAEGSTESAAVRTVLEGLARFLREEPQWLRDRVL
jgi:hypothetical protein